MAEAVTYYIVAYIVTTLCAFGCVTVLSGKTADADTLEAYRRVRDEFVARHLPPASEEAAAAAKAEFLLTEEKFAVQVTLARRLLSRDVRTIERRVATA